MMSSSSRAAKPPPEIKLVGHEGKVSELENDRMLKRLAMVSGLIVSLAVGTPKVLNSGFIRVPTSS